MTVLVTRPDAQGIELCQLLHQQGITALHHPLITISASPQLPELAEDLASFDIIIAVSQHAVTFSDQFLQHRRICWPNSAIYLAVGQKTAHVFSKACQQSVDYPEISDSEHLLALEALRHVAGKKILILRGNGGRELIYSTLVERGATVRYQEAYCRSELPFSATECVPQWQHAGVSSLVITSSEQLAFFVSQLNGRNLEWVQHLTLLVPSQRIAELAHNLGFHRIVTTPSAANRDLVVALMP
ncbi:uroporphyrinogen-III synthase [Vibrio sp. RC586]|uniref:uroporphyrinogen-III synthase n=1 Tax=Vibrio sp. RC586 TaxID=675815 RepID=UPI0001BB7D75|nr:uroporphyrinogen-III synthase [Vibrio sp. RC586]EEY98079.1 uroporphyrinogen-III synthase [Vibrio sp. RC586]